MEWIKKNPHLLTLAILAALLVGASAMVFLNTQSFGEKFSAVQTTVTPNNKVPELDLSNLETAQKSLDKPESWDKPPHQGDRYVFAPELYLIDEKTGQPMKPSAGNMRPDSLTKQQIPNSWFLENGLPLLDPGVTRQDPDSDGFWNEDEWRAKTNPKDKESRPPVYTKLFLKQYIAVPFRLKFQSWDGDPAKPEDMTFQINTLDLRQPTLFLKVGEKVGKSVYQIQSFAKKTVDDPNLGEKDVSELTVLNTETKDVVVLVLNQVANSPESFALFSYLWPNPPLEFRVKRIQEFVLLPNKQERYKLLDIQEAEAVIQLPSGEKYTVPRLPAGYP